MNTVAIAQARMGSTRLPGKVMMDLCGEPVIAWVYSTLMQAPGVDKVVIATSTLGQDDVINNWCVKKGIPVFRGSESDVLSRFVGAAEAHNADIILRATCDCPFIDPKVVGEVVALRKALNVDYCSNVDPPTWPDGLDIECFTRKALMESHLEAKNHSDRDCVTQYMMRNRSRFPAANLTCPIPGLDKERWVLDTEADYELCKKIASFFSRFGTANPPSYLRILKILDEHPEFRRLNANHIRNERFYDVLAAERRQPHSYERSGKALSRALRTIPLGAQTFSKSHIQFPGSSPLFLSHGDGCYAFDIDGNRFVDLVCGLLPNVLGYRDPDVDGAIRRQLDRGISFSLATELEAEVAEKLVDIIPSAEMVRFGKNGSDVTAAAVRLARAYTGRENVLLLDRNYHGWHDWSIASTERNFGVPQVMQLLTKRVGHDLNVVEHAILTHKYAAFMLEPEGLSHDWLRTVLAVCRMHGTLLIFDEIITGFRWSLGGYQNFIGVTPDISCFGKAMANGMPISALVGKSHLMKLLEPPNNIFYSGTFAGEALSLAAAKATIDKIEREGVCSVLWTKGEALRKKLLERIQVAGLEHVVSIKGDAPRLHVKFDDSNLQGVWMKAMVDAGVLIINANNMSYSLHGPAIKTVLKAYDRAFEAVCDALKGKVKQLQQFKAQAVR